MSSADPHYLEVRLAHATGKTQLLKLLAGSVWPVRGGRAPARQIRSRAR